MKIVIAAPYPRDLNKVRGGVEAVILYLAEGLRKFKDLNLHVVTLAGGIKKVKTVTSDRLTVHYLPAVSRFSYLNIYLDIWRLKQKIISLSPDVINAHIAGAYVLAALGSKYPTIVTLHGVRYREVETYKNAFIRFYRGWQIAKTERSSVVNARHIIAISPYIIEEFGDLVRADVDYIENPVSNKFFSVTDRSQPFHILFAGIISPRKQVLQLLQAVAIVRQSIPNVRLRLAGDKYDPFDKHGQYFSELHAFIAKEQLAENVSFLGNLSEDELIEEYEKCSLLALPSVQETTPMVIMQAMAAAKAVVATRVGGIPYQVQDGLTGLLVDVGDVAALAEALTNLLKNDTLRVNMGERGKEIAEKRFRTRLVAEKTREVYYRVAGHNKSSVYSPMDVFNEN